MLAASVFVCFAPQIKAQAQSIDEAARVATEFFNNKLYTGPEASRAASAPERVTTVYKADEPRLYVFNNTDSAHPGFVIVNADADNPRVMGYGYNGFPLTDVPEPARLWLDRLAEGGVAMTRSELKTSVEPLIKTHWSQDRPFNSAIPTLGAGYEPFVTGCVSTMFGQIMKYWKHPAKGVGARSYTIDYGEAGRVDFTADFGQTNYDWDNMLDSYNGGYTDEESAAVGTLLYHVGVASEMRYNFYESGANSLTGASALIYYFDYDRSMKSAMRTLYTDAEWCDLIYDELKSGRPIAYSGRRESGGHAFLLHGYDAETDLYAFNWGWGGYADGYYAMTGNDQLNPDISGDPAYAYALEQKIIYGIKPNEKGDYSVQINVLDNFIMKDEDKTQISSLVIDRANNEDRILEFNFTPINNGFADASFQYGLIFRDVNIGREFYKPGGSTNGFVGKVLPPGYYFQSPVAINVHTIIMQFNGVYSVEPAFSIDKGQTWQRMPYDASQQRYLIEVKGGISGINEVGGPEPDSAISGIYTPDGRKLTTPAPGVNIIKYSNGSVQKRFIKF